MIHSKKWQKRRRNGIGGGNFLDLKKKLFNSVLDQVENVLPLMPISKQELCSYSQYMGITNAGVSLEIRKLLLCIHVLLILQWIARFIHLMILKLGPNLS